MCAESDGVNSEPYCVVSAVAGSAMTMSDDGQLNMLTGPPYMSGNSEWCELFHRE